MAIEFPASLSSQSPFPSERERNRSTSAFAESPFCYDARDSREIFFAGADSEVSGSAEIIAEADVSPTLIQEMIAFLDSNGDGMRQEDEKEIVYLCHKNICIQRRFVPETGI